MSQPAQPPAAPASPAPAPVVARVAKIVLSDYRAFPADQTYEFNLGTEGKNLLLFGENGSGKTSLFHALRNLFSMSAPEEPYAGHRHVFTRGTEGAIVVVLTGIPPDDLRWQFGEEHPSTFTSASSFRSLARRSVFLDYKTLLKTNVLCEELDHVDVFWLLIDVLLRNYELPDGKTVGDRWCELCTFRPRIREGHDSDATEEDSDWLSAEQQVNEQAKSFSEMLNGVLNGSQAGVVAKANEFLRCLTMADMCVCGGQPMESEPFSIALRVGDLKVKVADAQAIRPPHLFDGADIMLTARYGGHTVAHPAAFLNEARLSAIALSLFLASTVLTTPTSSVAGCTPLLVLDDPLIGLDHAHRLPLLKILKSSDFAHWQVILMTYDRVWFELAKDHLPPEAWHSQRLTAKLMPEGWERPVLLDDHDHLEEAWGHVQAGDYAAAAVYLRTAFEAILQGFCEHRQLAVPFRRDARDYTTEDYWPLVQGFLLKKGHRLVNEMLAEEIKVCRRYVLNPLCHNDPGRPNREEVRSAYSAIRRLRTLLDQQLFWRKELDGRLQAAVKPLIGDNAKVRERALNGLAPATEFALMCACQLLKGASPPMSEVACLLRCALDKALWDYARRKGFMFNLRCDEPLTTVRVWNEAVDGAGGLRATQGAFVGGIEAHRDLLLAEAPCRDVFDSKAQADLKEVALLLQGTSSPENPKCVLAGF